MWYIQLCHQLSLTQQFYLYHLCPGREKKKVDPGQLIVSCHPDAVLNAQGRHDACRQMEYRPVLKDYKGYKKEHRLNFFFTEMFHCFQTLDNRTLSLTQRLLYKQKLFIHFCLTIFPSACNQFHIVQKKISSYHLGLL